MFNLLAPLGDQFILFNLFRYLTFRSGAACLTALILSFMIGPALIRRLRAIQREGQPIRTDGPERHLIEKKGTPTMGGVLILSTMTASVLLWADLRNGFVWAVLFVTLGYGLIGAADDYLKLTRRNTKGVSGRSKLIGQAAIGFATEVMDLFLCRDLERTEHNLDEDEFLEIEIGPFGWLVDELRAGRLTDVKTQIATFWLERMFSGAWPWPEFEREPASG